MANAVYPKFKEALLTAAANVDVDDLTVKAVLVDLADYSYSATHEFLTSLPAGARVGTPQTIANSTVTNGVFDGDDVTFPAVSGDQCEAIVLYIDTGTEATSRLVAFFDTGVTGLPVTPNGGSISIAWSGSGIFSL